jgi:hypothetical protein
VLFITYNLTVGHDYVLPLGRFVDWLSGWPDLPKMAGGWCSLPLGAFPTTLPPEESCVRACLACDAPVLITSIPQ